MLNLFLKKANNNTKSELEFFNGTNVSSAQALNNNNSAGETRHYPPASKEWKNSIYSYNKNSIKTLPIVDNTVNNLIKGYFNLNPLSNDKKSSRVQVRFKRLSLNRILVSRAEMKHTNNKVIITVYLYNKNKKFFLYKLKNLYKTFIFKIEEKRKKLSLSRNASLQTRVAKPGNLPIAFAQNKVNRAGSKLGLSYVFNNKSKSRNLNNGASAQALNDKSFINGSLRVKNTNLAQNQVSVNDSASALSERNKYKITLLNPATNVKNNSSSVFSSKRFKNSSQGRVALKKQDSNTQFIRTNYYLNFTKLSKRNLSNFLLAINNAKKNTGGTNLLKNKYKSLIKKYYFLLSNNKLNTINNNNYFLNYVNIAKTNSSLKNNNIALLENASEKSNLFRVEQGDKAFNFSSGAGSSLALINNKSFISGSLYYLGLASLKKNSFFTSKLASGLAPGQQEHASAQALNDKSFINGSLRAKSINNSYYRLFDNAKNSFAFENVFQSSIRKPNTFEVSAKKRKSDNAKKDITLVGWALYKLRNLHKLFNISPSNITFEGQQSSPNASEIVNSGDLTLKKRNFLLRNLHNILKNLKINSSKANVKTNANGIINAPSLKLSLKKINSISLKGLRILKKARKNKNFILKTLKWNNKNFINYETKYYKNFINKSYRKEILYLYYVKMLSLNNNKFKNWFILGLKRIISKIYHKKVEFNFVNLKYLHLNSDIFSESIAIKLRNRENKLLRILKKALKLVKLPSLSKLSYYGLPSEKTQGDFSSKNESLTLNLNSYISTLKDKDVLHELLYKIFPRWQVANTEITSINKQAQTVKNNLEENILNSTKHKNIYGVRLEAAGRLSRRLTASRSIFKLKYKGSLKIINSSYKGLSTVMLRGNTRSNIQLTKISSKTRNGAFGLKGWISSN